MIDLAGEGARHDDIHVSPTELSTFANMKSPVGVFGSGREIDLNSFYHSTSVEKKRNIGIRRTTKGIYSIPIIAMNQQ